MLRDIGLASRSALRSLSRHQSDTAAAVLLFALAVLAHVGAGAFVRGIVLSDLPYSAPERLVRISQSQSRNPSGRANIAYGTFLFWSEHARSFEHLAAFSEPVVDFLLAPRPGASFEPVKRLVVTEDFFNVLGVPPAMGRTFDSAESDSGPRIIIVSDRFWRRRLDGDPNVIGRPVRGVTYDSTVVGVMPPGFDYPSGVEVWYPGVVPPDLRDDHSSRALSVIGRLAPDASVVAGSAELSSLGEQIQRGWPGVESGWEPNVALLADDT